jgi:ATP-binding cassette subfamily C protein
MISSLQTSRDLIAKTYKLAEPFGRKKLAGVALISLIQGIFSVVGVTSIFPFLALASDPDRLRNSNFGSRLLDALPDMSNSQMLVITGIFAIAMLLFSNFISFMAMKSRTGYATAFAHWMRMQVIRKIIARPYGDFLQFNSGVFLKKVLADVERFTSSILLPMLGLLTCFNTVILLVAVLIYVHPEIALTIGLILTFVYGLIFSFLGKWRRKASKQLKESQEGLYKQTQQTLVGVKPIKVHCVEEDFMGKISIHSVILARIMKWNPLVGQVPRFIIEPAALGSVVLAVIYYVVQGQELATILPNLGVMAIAGYRLLPNIQAIYSSMTTLGTARHALDEIYAEIEVVDKGEDMEKGAKEGRFDRSDRLEWSRAIMLKNITFQYPSATAPALKSLNLTISKNSSLGIIGSTGSGKSTLVDLILGLHIPTDGCIQLDEAVLNTSNRRAWRMGIGYVPQDIFLLDDSISNNIAFGVPEVEIDQDAVIRAAKAAQIHAFIESELLEGYDTVVGERGVRLSGGQRQRVGLARALYHQPDVLVLDEATSALDTKTEAEVMKAIDSLQGSLTLIIIAHRLTTVQGCDSILDMDQLVK